VEGAVRSLCLVSNGHFVRKGGGVVKRAREREKKEAHEKTLCTLPAPDSLFLLLETLNTILKKRR
jgi:hypothetical protein